MDLVVVTTVWTKPTVCHRLEGCTSASQLGHQIKVLYKYCIAPISTPLVEIRINDSALETLFILLQCHWLNNALHFTQSILYHTDQFCFAVTIQYLFLHFISPLTLHTSLADVWS